MTVVYKDSAQNITLEDAMRIYKDHGVCVIVNDGKHVTLEDEF